MMVFTHNGTGSLELVKQHEPQKWLTRLAPYIKALNTLRVIKNITFYNATMIYCSGNNDQGNIIYALASYKHIMSKINEYNTVCQNIAQYSKQLCALSSAIGYTDQAKTDLQKHYQHKISALTYKKRQLQLHDEVISCLVESDITLIPK